MAYMNARLVAQPEKDWLLAPDMVTDIDEELQEAVENLRL